MSKKLYAVRVTITYDGVGTSPEQAVSDAWNTINNDSMFQLANIETRPVDIEDTNFDTNYLIEISEEE